MGATVVFMGMLGITGCGIGAGGGAMGIGAGAGAAGAAGIAACINSGDEAKIPLGRLIPAIWSSLLRAERCDAPNNAALFIPPCIMSLSTQFFMIDPKPPKIGLDPP